MSIDVSRGGPGARRIVVEGAVLSSYIGERQIDLLKMDIEGAEEQVLRETAIAGVLRNVREIAVEYHHNLEEGSSRFASFLQLFQDAGYHYQIDATWKGGGSAGVFQDILVRARRSTQGVRYENAPALRRRPGIVDQLVGYHEEHRRPAAVGRSRRHHRGR